MMHLPSFTSGFFLFLFLISSPALAQPRQLNLTEVILAAEQYSPDVKASTQGEEQAHQGIRISRAAYFPTLDLTAVDSIGFPGSADPPPGSTGMMAYDGMTESPYRVGPAASAYTSLKIFDLTREYGVSASKAKLRAAREQTQVERLQTDMKAVSLYMDAVLNREQRDAWKGIQDKIDHLYGSILKFVRNGQYSKVTQWLLKEQEERAVRNEGVFNENFVSATEQIELLIGAPSGSVSIQGIQSLKDTLEKLNRSKPPESPLVLTPKYQAQTSREIVSVRASENYPKLLGIASAGTMDAARLVPEQGYSAWLGLSLPLFEGFRLTAQEQEARADADRKDDLAQQAKLDLAEADTKYEQETRAQEIEITQFEKQARYSAQALQLAEHRYLTFVGDLADVRDALYSYEDSISGLNAAQVELFRSQLFKAIIDGGRVSEK